MFMIVLFVFLKDEKETHLAGLIGKSNRMGGTGSLVLGEIAKAYAQEDKFEGDWWSLNSTFNNLSGMGFEGIVMTVRVRDFLFDGIKTGSAGWMIGLRKDQERKNVLFITDRLPITVFGYENGFALFNHKNDTMENEWYEVGVPKKERALNYFLSPGWNWATRVGQAHNDHQVGPAERVWRRNQRKQYAVKSVWSK